MDKEQHIKKLCEQLRTGDHSSNQKVIAELRKKGWLTDGSLYGADLHGAYLVEANLSGADLSEANLIGADLSGAYLAKAYLFGADLAKADLSGAYLSGAYLSRADLSGADLSGANLVGADLSGAYLSGANLSGADLIEANLIGADLSRANLVGANLIGVNLRGTNLRDTDFTNVILSGTIFADVDLTQAKGLETVTHQGPSHISTDTFYKSKGNIPVAFLKGCGVPDDYIAYILPLTGKVIEFYSCFISYSHAQKDFARRLHNRLQGEGIRCWLDEHQMAPGQDIYEEVNRGIRLWDKVLLCCSEESLTSWWVDNEVGIALEKEEQLMKERNQKIRAIIPLDLDGYLFNWQSERGYEAQLRRRLAADFKDWKNEDAFEESFQQVLKALRTDEGREIPPPSQL